MKDMKIWLIADTHFGLKGDDEEWLDDYVGYFENEVIPYMKENAGPDDILVHCGDVFDCRATIGLNTLTRVISLFENFSKIFKDIRITTGNHDIYKKSSNEITSLNVLKHIPNVKIYYEPELDVIAGKQCLFNPWIEDSEREKEVLARYPNAEYVFGHFMIGGSQMTDKKGVKSDVMGGVPASAFGKAQVYAGHIHIRQDRKNIHYVGNPYHKDRGDRDNAKGITVLDIRTGKTEFIENTVSPRFLKENIYDILNLTMGDLKERWKNNRIDLHIKGADIVKCNFDDMSSVLGNIYRSFNPVADGDAMELDTSNSDIDFEDAKTSDEYIGDFIEHQDVDDPTKEWLLNKMNEYKERLG